MQHLAVMQHRAVRRVAEVVGSQPLLPVALKAAVAAALAWLVVQPLRGAADDYAYYAPLGAVVVVSSRLGQSVRASVETVLAIGLGALLALAVRGAPVPEMVGIGLVVGIGTLIGAWRRVGSMASWVPISSLFILIIGGSEPTAYVLAYLGLTAIGAAVGVLVNVIAPPLPLVATRQIQDSLRELLADQMEGLAQGLRRDTLPTSESWRDGVDHMEARARRARELVSQTQDAARMNWRVRRSRETAERQQRKDVALNELTFLLQEIITLLAHQEHAHLSDVALGPHLRPSAADALSATVRALRSVEDASADPEAHAAATEATDRFAHTILTRRDDGHGEMFAAGSLVNGLRRLLHAIAPEEEPQS